jgi:hypothetical protein
MTANNSIAHPTTRDLPRSEGGADLAPWSWAGALLFLKRTNP